MDAAQLIQIAVQASILLLVFALGLGASHEDATYLLRRPALLGRALSMYLVVPKFAATLAALFSLTPAAKIVLILMAVSPVPPILPGKQLKLGGRANYVYGLLVAASLSAILFAPLAIEMLGRILSRDAHVSVGLIAKVVSLTVLLSIVIGMALRHFAPALAQRIAPIASGLGNVLLVAVVIPILVAGWPGVVALIGNGTIIAIAAVVIGGLVSGHLLGGPRARRPGGACHRALRCGIPGVALPSLCHLSGHKSSMAAVLLFILVKVVVTIPYMAPGANGARFPL